MTEGYFQRKQKLKQIPLEKNPLESLELIRSKYEKIKEFHFELPALKIKTFRNMKLVRGCKTDSRVAHAHSHVKTKSVCFSQPFLKRLAYINRVGNQGEWRILIGTLAVVELLTHEITHWKVRSGVHNKQFYKTQKRYLDTLINHVISGEYYL